MYALFVIIVAVLIMLAVYGMIGFIAWAAVKGLNEITDEILEFLKWKRIRETEMRRI